MLNPNVSQVKCYNFLIIVIKDVLGTFGWVACYHTWDLISANMIPDHLGGRAAHSMLVYSWTTVFHAGPVKNQHCVIGWGLLIAR